MGPASEGALPARVGLTDAMVLASAMGQGVAITTDVADCTASADGTARYFVSVRTSSGVDVPNAIGRLFGTGTENAGQVVNMFNGDLESQADDGNPRSGCVPRPHDGRPNDLGSTFVPAAPGTHTWKLQVLAPGFAPAPAVDLAPFVDGSVCPLGDGAGCLISLGTIVLTGVGVPSSGGIPTPTTSRSSVPLPPPATALPLPAPPLTPAISTRTPVPEPTVMGPPGSPSPLPSMPLPEVPTLEPTPVPEIPTLEPTPLPEVPILEAPPLLKECPDEIRDPIPTLESIPLPSDCIDEVRDPGAPVWVDPSMLEE